MGAATVLALPMFVVAGLLWALGWAGGSRRLRPGSLAGIRTRATTRSEEAWYASQAAAARWENRGAVVMVAGGFVTVSLGAAGASLVGLNLVSIVVFCLLAWCVWRAVRDATEQATRADQQR